MEDAVTGVENATDEFATTSERRSAESDLNALEIDYCQRAELYRGTYVVKLFSFFRIPPKRFPMPEERLGMLGAANVIQFAFAAERNDRADADLVMEAIQTIYSDKLNVTGAPNWMTSKSCAQLKPWA